MSSYKNYMDRIRVDDEQHEKLLEAVRAAEAEQAAGGVKNEQPAKVRRFPLKGLALIASAAAVIVLAVGVLPGVRRNQEAANTIAADTRTPGEMEQPVNENRSEPENAMAVEEKTTEVVKEDSASAQTRTSYGGTEASATRTEPAAQAPTATPAQPAEQASAVTQAPAEAAVPDTSEVPAEEKPETSEPTGMKTDTKNGAAQTEDGYDTQTDSLYIRKTALGSEETAVYSYTVSCSFNGETDAAPDPESDLYSLLMDLKDRLGSADPAAVLNFEADFSFGLNGEELSYDSEEGLIRDDELEYALNESEHAALNELLDELLTTE